MFPNVVKIEIKLSDNFWFRASVGYVVYTVIRTEALIVSFQRNEALKLFILNLIPVVVCLATWCIAYNIHSQKPTISGTLALCRCAILSGMS